MNHLSAPMESSLVLAHSLFKIDNPNEEVLGLLVDNEGITSSMEEIEPDLSFNPLKDILESVNEHMCSSCLFEDDRFKDEFFLSLFKGYVHYLFYYYGRRVGINQILAKRVFEHIKLFPNVEVCVILNEDDIEINEHNADIYFSEPGYTNFFLFYNSEV